MQASFCFAVREKEEGIAFLDVVVVSAAIEHFTCSCLCCVCVCMAGRYCFRLIAAVVVDFSPLLFTHTHTCRSFSSFILLPKKEKRETFSLFIHIYILILILFLFFSPYVITHNSSFLLICCIPFSSFTLPFFSLSLSF